jgi:hypothetical protein
MKSLTKSQLSWILLGGIWGTVVAITFAKPNPLIFIAFIALIAIILTIVITILEG